MRWRLLQEGCCPSETVSSHVSGHSAWCIASLGVHANQPNGTTSKHHALFLLLLCFCCFLLCLAALRLLLLLLLLLFLVLLLLQVFAVAAAY